MSPANQSKIQVSIIIPAYNVENYIEECIHSAFAQTYPHIEVICIDNNSTDQTWQKIEQLKQQYPTLIIDKEMKPGAPVARNKGLNLSKGEWLQFLDADDLLMPGKIEHQVELLSKSGSNTSFIAASSIIKDLSGSENIGWFAEDNPFKSLFTKKLGNTCANLWNRNYIEKIGGWAETLKSSQEADLMLRLLQINDNVLFDDEPLTIIRERPTGQISKGDNYDERWTRYFKKRVEIKQWLRKNKPELYEKEKDFFNDTLFGILRVIAMKDINKAYSLFREYMNRQYEPSPEQQHSTSSYIFLYKILGFKNAEYLKRMLRRH